MLSGGVAAPFLPPARRGGRPQTADMREVLNAMLFVAASGCAWRLLPKCFPPVSTVRRHFYAWRNFSLFESINTVLVMNLREIEGREASPSAGVINSQSVKTTEGGGISDFDAGKKFKRRKRNILTDTCGFLIFILVHAADIQDRDGAVDVLSAIRTRFPWLRHVFADGGYAGKRYGRRSSAWESGRSKSSSIPTKPRVSRCYPADGLSSESGSSKLTRPRKANAKAPNRKTKPPRKANSEAAPTQ